MIFLTGDVHHNSLGTKELPYINPLSEARLAEEYLSITANYDLNVTLFITGKTFIEDLKDLEHLFTFGNLEIGGHTFDGFSPFWLHRGIKLIKSSYWRSFSHQYEDVKKTVDVIKATTGTTINSWRNHCFEYDKNTIHILEELGITVWSDEITMNGSKPYKVTDRLISLPVNTISDHNMLYHGYRTEQWVASQNSRRNRAKKMLKNLLLKRNIISNNPKSYHADDWLRMLLSDVEAKLKDGGIVVLNIHPVCMYLLDKFQTFRKICKFLSQYTSFFATEAKDCL